MPRERNFSQYYKVIPDAQLDNYQFIRTLENEVPQKLRSYTYENRKKRLFTHAAREDG